MPNIVNEMLSHEFEKDFRDAGSCLVLGFTKLTVEQAEDLRNRFRDAGIRYKVVKNRLAVRALRTALDVDMSDVFRGKCGVVFAPEERAISAAKIVREAMRQHRKAPPVTVVGGLIEGEPITGAAAGMIADMPDRDTVRAQLACAISGPARGLAIVVQGLASGLARCIQSKVDKEGEEGG